VPRLSQLVFYIIRALWDTVLCMSMELNYFGVLQH
jgi:hypothetical protein